MVGQGRSRDLSVDVQVKRGCLLILRKAFFLLILDLVVSLHSHTLTHIWRSPRWSRPRPLPGALVRLLVCLPQKSWPLISQEFLEEAVVRDDSARPCSAFHLSSASALSSLPHLLPYCILLILLYSASLFLSGHPLNRSSILSLFILSSERCVWDDLCVCVCLREGRRPNNVCRKIL